MSLKRTRIKNVTKMTLGDTCDTASFNHLFESEDATPDAGHYTFREVAARG